METVNVRIRPGFGRNTHVRNELPNHTEAAAAMLNQGAGGPSLRSRGRENLTVGGIFVVPPTFHREICIVPTASGVQFSAICQPEIG